MRQIEDLSGDRLSFTVAVVSRASRSEIIGWTGSGRLKIRVAAPPVEDAANRELIKLVARTLGVAKADVAIVTGARSRTKTLVVPGSCKKRLSTFGDI